MASVSVQNVSKFYSSHTALKGVSMEVPEGSIFGLLGPNGAGKTSLIRIINQITAPDQGMVKINGELLKPHHIHQIGYLPEERGLYPKMKAGEQVIYLARLKGLSKQDARDKARKWFQRFGMESWWNKNIEELSKGMAQKVQFVSTVIHEPSLLIFDEPFTGFDPINTNLIKSEIKLLRDAGATVIFSTHRMESVEEICDRIALINRSEKILEGPLKSIQQEYKSNKYIVELANEEAQPPTLSDGSVLLSSTKEEGIWKLEIQLEEHLPNKLLTQLMSQGNVLLFKELIPSLDKIFIQKVSSL
ncbi:MAG TPA: ABC transporter ATP-binding protein [Cryomorphaceae bacterium]|nr:ABC transporter ATP-binding protein [Owenweeksia sp.]MBF97929.1 ABC transporter ATP-binding protein [Owenweeksia sp.]HAD98024.1 ABC transporter ATP-binding protein [Cryomorphaceae bacterium]HBF20899.1 ABC transporter ATP-binding protein [Cryomorphaceae bacterium]|tara:strand:+ start:2323 stop:3231 length:909 start_codon:yes stop_codon:yes gene_type:complete